MARKRNREQENAYGRAYKLANKERLAEKRKTPEAKEKFLAATKRWQAKNMDKVKEQRKSYWKDPMKRAAATLASTKRRYPNSLSDDGSSDPEQLGLWLEVAMERKCKYCGSEAVNHLDHIHPLSKGGKHEWTNIQMICKTCNIAKHNHTEDEFLGWAARVANISAINRSTAA